MAESFAARFAAVRSAQGPLVCGLDPSGELLDGWRLGDTPDGLDRFADIMLEAATGAVGLIKPQSAFYERHGSRGIAVLERVIETSRAAGALVLLDVKRGDIGSTSQAYADAYLRPTSALAVDAITVSPFLGLGSLEPAFAAASEHGGGVFVLALTSNPEGPEVQSARAADGRTVAGVVLEGLRERNREALREAYFAVPRHLRHYCGDMDSKDWPIRRILQLRDDE